MRSLQTPDTDRRFRRHQYLAHAGEEPQQVYRLEEGWACRFRLLRDGRRQIVALFLPGELCEPQWAFSHRAVPPVVALTPLRPRATALRNLREPPQDYLDSLLVALNRQTEWIVSLGRRTATERLCALIHDIFSRMRVGGRVSDDRCTMPLTQYELADILGLTPVHVNRVLKTLRDRGLFEVRDSTLNVPDPDRLQKLAAE